MNIKKVIRNGLVLIVALVVLSIAYITVVLDPNDYKPDIVTKVRLSSERDLLIDGDLSWRFFPNIGLTVGHTIIKNPEGFPDKPLLEFDKAELDVAFMPLLNKRIEVGMVTLEGLTLNLVTSEDGKRNIDASDSENKSSEQTTDTNQTSSSDTSLSAFSIEGVQVINAAINIEDLQNKTSQHISDLNFKLNSLKLGKDVGFSFSAKVGEKDKPVLLNTDATLNIGEKLKVFQLKDLNTSLAIPVKEGEESINLNGEFTANITGKPALDFILEISPINLDALIGNTTNTEQSNKPDSTEPLDFSWMKSFDMKGMINLESIKVSNLNITQLKFPLVLNNGVMSLNNIEASLYEGSFNSDISLDSNSSVPEFSFKADLTDVQALPFVKDFMEKEFISGTMAVNLDMKGQGLDEISIRKNTKGSGQFGFTDGAIQGVNIAQMIRSGYAKLKGQTMEESSSANQTDFASFTGSFNLIDGLLTNKDLSLMSPLLRVSGNGTANIIDETLNYNLKTAVVGTLEGQGGKAISELKNLSIPLNIKGDMNDPDISLDMQELLKDKAKESLKDKLKDKLKGIFGK